MGDAPNDLNSQALVQDAQDHLFPQGFHVLLRKRKLFQSTTFAFYECTRKYTTVKTIPLLGDVLGRVVGPSSKVERRLFLVLMFTLQISTKKL